MSARATRMMAGALERLRREERGLTVVEGVIAAMLLVVGALGVLQLFDASTRNTFRAEQSQVVNNQLQAELEEIKQLPYDQIAMTGYPGASADPKDPRSRVANTVFAVDRSGAPGSQQELVVNGGPIPAAPVSQVVAGGVISPEPTPFSTGDVSGQIYRFVTWTSDPNCAECGDGAMKRIIVAAKVDGVGSSFDRTFQEVQTDVVDPDITPDENPLPPAEEQEGNVAELWLTDTTCNNATRQPITGDHPGHNTRGICANGLKTGSTRGAPDLMFTEGPALEPNDQTPPLFDYANDPGAEPATGASLDRGLLMPTSYADSCALAPVLNTLDVRRLLDGVLTILDLPALPGQLDGVLDITGGDAAKHQRVHTWVSPPISGSGGVLLGEGTLELYTKTINGATHPGEICAWMSVRQPVTIPARLCVLVCVPLGSTTIEVDLPMVNVGLLSDGECRTGLGLNLANFAYAQNPWPSVWSKISMPLCFAQVNSAGAVIPAVLPPSSRIAMSIMVKKSGTLPGGGLEFMYDHPDFESRLQLETNQLLSF